MQINISFDQLVSTLPAGFVSAINYVVNLYDRLFTAKVTVNINVGYGEINGQSLWIYALGESEANYIGTSYDNLRNALIAANSSEAQYLPTSDPFGGRTLAITNAESQALFGQSLYGVDGYVGFNSTSPFSYTPGATPASNQYYFIGVAEHEISEVLGRVSNLANGNYYSPMDLFRYSAANQLAFASGSNAAYFSLTGGITDLVDFNTDTSGDVGDFAASAGNDPFLAFSSPGVVNDLTKNDTTLLDSLDWGSISLPQADFLIGAPGGTLSIYTTQNSTPNTPQVGTGGYVQAGNFIWQYEGWTPVTGDFNGDGRSDILLYNTSLGEMIVYSLGDASGTTIQSGGVVLNSGGSSVWQYSSWTPIIGDFNGDGRSDILLYNTSLGEMIIYGLGGANNSVIQWGGDVLNAGGGSVWQYPGWTPISGDFNGDGKSDILLYNTRLGEMIIYGLGGANNSVIQWGGDVLAADLVWQHPGWTAFSGDFNGDGKSDIFLYNSSTGQAIVYGLGGANQTTIQWGDVIRQSNGSVAYFGTGLTPLVGDFNGDGKKDIAFYNSTTGKILICGLGGANSSVIQWGGYYNFSSGSPWVGWCETCCWRFSCSGDYCFI